VPSPLNRVPFGLLDFFGIKSGEWGPRELGQTLAPTIDLTRWYLDQYATELRFTFANFAVNTPANNLEITATTPIDITTGGILIAPQNETWCVLQADLFWSIGDVGGSIDCHLNSGENAGPAAWPMTLLGFQTGAAVLRSGSRSLDSPYWVLPGQRIRVGLNGAIVGAGTISLTGRLRIARMQR
jgi:hypothetical protein